VAFGTQSLVKDLFYGFLILAENQFAVGDLIQVGSTTGRVRQMTFRTVLITDEAGRLHYVPNGDLARVTVLPGGPVAEPVEWELGVPSGELDVVWETVERVCGELKDTAPAEPITLIEGPRVVFGEPVPTGGVRLRVKAKAALNTSWEVSRRFQELLVDALSEVSHEPVRLTLWVNQAAPVPGAPLAAAAAVRD
jgi:small conductance mechanosensitive channel